MRKLLVGNAPCSWGTLEFDAAKGEQIPFGIMLDELAETGYTGTELGDWGYMPTNPVELSEELARRELVLADNNGTEPDRTHLAGRVTAESGLSATEWKVFAGGADRLARVVFEETGLR